MQCQWKDKVLSVKPDQFDALALEVFGYQYAHNPVYRQYVQALGIDLKEVTRVENIPFLPIRFFKSHKVVTTDFIPSLEFESSGTTAMINSRHLVKDASLYEASYMSCFGSFYGSPSEWCILGLLPSYLERKNSSLVHMVDGLIKKSGHNASGFYLNEHEELFRRLISLFEAGQKTLLIGVTFGLLDFAEAYAKHFPPGLFKNVTVMETGGMKGRRREMIREEVHTILKQAFDLPAIHSEYGMTELLSQAYSPGNGRFHSPPWMKVLLRDEEDPLTLKPHASSKPVSGSINVIDLANIYSCSFIATDDLGRSHPDGSFEVLGRIDNSDLRGCSLMVAAV